MKKLKDMANIPTKIAADILGKDNQWVRIGLQRGALPIGTAIKNDERYSYHISYHLLEAYVGKERIEQYEATKKEKICTN